MLFWMMLTMMTLLVLISSLTFLQQLTMCLAFRVSHALLHQYVVQAFFLQS